MRMRPYAVAVALLVSGCTRFVAGQALPGNEPEPGVLAAAAALLSQEQMQAVTGAGEDLTAIPTMDGTAPADDTTLAAGESPECRFLFVETATFGTDFDGFHKTTYQDPPHRAIISQGVALYSDPAVARRAFDALADTVQACAASPSAPLVGTLTSGPDWLRIRPGDCGRDYRLKSAALIEVTFCGMSPSVPEIVVANIADRVPG